MINSTEYVCPKGVCHKIAPLKWYIGEYYQYPDGGRKRKLKEVRGWVFEFDDGHWCTDTVFMDLIRVKTGLQVYKDLQLTLEL